MRRQNPRLLAWLVAATTLLAQPALATRYWYAVNELGNIGYSSVYDKLGRLLSTFSRPLQGCSDRYKWSLGGHYGAGAFLFLQTIDSVASKICLAA